MADAILALQILSSMDTSLQTVSLQADADGNHRIGVAEVIFILQKMAGLWN